MPAYCGSPAEVLLLEKGEMMQWSGTVESLRNSDELRLICKMWPIHVHPHRISCPVKLVRGITGCPFEAMRFPSQALKKSERLYFKVNVANTI
jgi:hypothetical protein